LKRYVSVGTWRNHLACDSYLDWTSKEIGLNLDNPAQLAYPNGLIKEVTDEPGSITNRESIPPKRHSGWSRFPEEVPHAFVEKRAPTGAENGDI
jgi:hypothetical protein